MIFKNRLEAAKKLCEKFQKFNLNNGVILSIPNGGVEIGYVLSQELNLPLDVVIAKKITHPQNPEFAIGSVNSKGDVVNDVAKQLGYSIEDESIKLKEILQNKYTSYRDNGIPQLEIKNKEVILCDDGIATGNTMLCAIKLIKSHNPNKIIVVTPVSSPESYQRIKREIDEIICLEIDPDFKALSNYYENFYKVSDNEVIRLLKESKLH